MNGFIDGDFDSGVGSCFHHCSPTCHPAQIGPDWKYGCRHPAWPGNRAHDFVPIVNCGGVFAKCDLVKEKKLLGRFRGGLTRRIKTAQKKLDGWKKQLEELEELTRAAQ